MNQENQPSGAYGFRYKWFRIIKDRAPEKDSREISDEISEETARFEEFCKYDIYAPGSPLHNLSVYVTRYSEDSKEHPDLFPASADTTYLYITCSKDNNTVIFIEYSFAITGEGVYERASEDGQEKRRKMENPEQLSGLLAILRSAH